MLTPKVGLRGGSHPWFGWFGVKTTKTKYKSTIVRHVFLFHLLFSLCRYLFIWLRYFNFSDARYGQFLAVFRSKPKKIIISLGLCAIFSPFFHFLLFFVNISSFSRDISHFGQGFGYLHSNSYPWTFYGAYEEKKGEGGINFLRFKGNQIRYLYKNTFFTFSIVF